MPPPRCWHRCAARRGVVGDADVEVLGHLVAVDHGADRTSAPPTWRGASANSPGSATTATTARTSCKSSTACCATATAARSPSRCSTARRSEHAGRPAKVKQRFALERVVFVGDRGLITSARIRGDLQPAGLDWITALRAPSIQQLAEGGPLQLALFDERDPAQITASAYPGERLIVYRNPLLAAERQRGARQPPGGPKTTCRCTASAACCATSPPSC